ncbi:Peptidase C14 caspase domain protein [Rutstroemia sp. NJR-2017a BVV2]|nr:Peptidase C14 caspase domain protein [Rutstroemia sp. NJR-2017a BVV2]
MVRLPPAVHDFPEGLPRLAALMNSNDSFALCRRFGRLSDRLLLHLQVKLTDLEKELDEIDKADEEHPRLKFRNYGYEGFEEDKHNPRKAELLSEILETFEKYDISCRADKSLTDEPAALLSRVTELRTRGRAPSHQYQYLFRWVWDNKPLGEGIYDFIFHAEDFVSTADNDNSFEDFIEANLADLPIIKSLLLSKAPHQKAKDEYSALHYSDAYFQAFSKLLAVCIAVALLLIPTFLLYLVPMNNQGMAWVVFGFVFAFSTTFAMATQGKVQDVFIATAAYVFRSASRSLFFSWSDALMS